MARLLDEAHLQQNSSISTSSETGMITVRAECERLRWRHSLEAGSPRPSPQVSLTQEQVDLQPAVAAPSAPLPDSLSNLVWWDSIDMDVFRKSVR